VHALDRSATVMKYSYMIQKILHEALLT
jgi:hypothetical protein